MTDMTSYATEARKRLLNLQACKKIELERMLLTSIVHGDMRDTST